ncbi:hypothetical protein Dsin_001584 [Dipteronia sinensis]|uniref:Uncharacterized protein n=1 Tax=Dipteronia sinensis TaxID=43782 RepID=A0AAE0EIH3_9ROSI|nr:hypothetical protein Dsin_001584 [Dipteronia sinensis]
MQQLESVKQITKLEAECKRLRLFILEKLSVLTTSAKMKGKVEMWGNNDMEMRRREMIPSRDLIFRKNPRRAL